MDQWEYINQIRKKLRMIERIMANLRVTKIKETWIGDRFVVKEGSEKTENK